jgi:hypothetical protein
MAKMGNGINGKITGKVGSVIGSHWRGISYIRSVPNKKKKISSPAQMQQQARFSLMANFLNIFKSLLSISFSKYTMRMTGSNKALSFNLLGYLSKFRTQLPGNTVESWKFKKHSQCYGKSRRSRCGRF